MRRILTISTALFGLLCTLPAPVTAQGWQPTRPIKMICPFPAGGGTDQIARIVAMQLTNRLGQQVYVENRGGANGGLGAQEVMRAEPDGYTIGAISDSPMTVNPWMYEKLAYRPLQDFIAVARINHFPSLLVAHPSTGIKTVAELIKVAKEKPGTLNYGHSGIGSLQHLAAEWLAVKAGIKMQGIAYRGTGPAVLELMGGRIDLVVTSLGDFSGQAKAGQLRVLTLIDDIGSPQFPDAPQASATVPGYAVTGWVGVCGPRGLPASAIRWWEKATEAALTDPDLQKRLPDFGLTPGYENAEAFAKTITAEQARWKAVIDANNIRAE